MKIMINGQVRDMTSNEETQLEEDRKIIAAAHKIRTDAKADKETKKASGKQKLLDLGLSEEEVKALIGV
jgi:hypothetical protein